MMACRSFVLGVAVALGFAVAPCQAQELFQRSVESVYNRGIAAFKRGDFATMRDCMDTVVKANLSDQPVLTLSAQYHLAAANLHMGNEPAARATIADAVGKSQAIEKPKTVETGAADSRAEEIEKQQQAAPQPKAAPKGSLTSRERAGLLGMLELIQGPVRQQLNLIEIQTVLQPAK
jgi:hypothetical protein